MLSIEDQRLRDEIEFEGFQRSEFITIGDADIRIKVAYSEELSKTIRNIGGGHWDRDLATWIFPFSAWRRIAAVASRINNLAKSTQESRHAETLAQDAERKKREHERTEEARQREKTAAALRPRGMKSSYAKGVEGRPLFHIELESIGDPVANGTAAFGMPIRAYISQVMGYDGQRFVFSRLSGCRDYSKANSKGSRGILISFQLEEGPIYFVSSPQTWRSRDKFFCLIENGNLRRLTDEEVLECLEK